MKFGTAQNGQRRLFNFISKIFLMQQKTSARTLLLCLSSKIRQIQTSSLLKFLFVFIVFTFPLAQMHNLSEILPSLLLPSPLSAGFLKEAVTLAPHFS